MDYILRRTLSAVLILIVTLHSPVLAMNVGATDSFIKVIKKIGTQEARDAIVCFVTEKDPQAGIVARDLVEKLVESKNREDIANSTIEVVTTMLFLKNIQPSINQFVDENPEILKQAESAGWNRSKLIAYTGLYYFFSERKKYNLPVPNEIYTHYEKERLIIEGLHLRDKKWTGVISKQFIPSKRDPKKWFISDVRAVLVFQQILVASLNGEDISARTGLMAEKLLKSVKLKDVETPDQLVNALIDGYKEYLFQNLQDSELDGSNIQLSDQFLSQAVILPVFQPIVSENIALIGTENIKNEISKSVTTLINSWVTTVNKNSIVSYHVMVSSNLDYINSDLNFSIQDQIRVHPCDQIFGFIGGFLDPTLQTNPENKIIPIGLGYTLGRWAAFAYSGYPLSNLKTSPSIGFGISYEVKFSDLDL